MLGYENRIVNSAAIEKLGILAYANCIVCAELMLPNKCDPQYCTDCEKAVFCSKCINDWTRRNNSCPNCRKQNPKLEKFSKSKTLKTVYDTIKVTCRNEKAGCKHTANLNSIEYHEATKCDLHRTCDLCNEKIGF